MSHFREFFHEGDFLLFKSSDFLRLISPEFTLFFPLVFFLLKFLNFKIFGSFELPKLGKGVFIEVSELFFL